MKISRRNFLGKALKSLAVVVVAPTALAKYPNPPRPEPIRPIGNEDKGEVIGFRKYGDFECNDFTRQISILEYTPGMEIPYESPAKPSCAECMYTAKCTSTGKEFADSMKEWNRKLQNRLMKDTILRHYL